MTTRVQRRVSAAIGRSWRLAAIPFMVAGLGGPVLAQAPPPTEDPASQQQASPTYEETVEVVGATPIHGVGVDRDKIPSNVQTATADALKRTGGSSIGEQMNLGMPSVHVNEATTNPFQPDLQFRGFVGSPLLGLPQGLAVYQNGVRLNESFGDTVNWDLIPTNAISSINLMPGSNPLFGLNALGGAISIQTKTGFSHPGHSVSVSGGSFGRQWVEAEGGGHTDRVSYFVAGSALSEDGWRDFSPSQVRQLFGDVAWRGGSTTLNATVTSGVNRLIGNGAVPIELLDEDRSAIFTYPDETKTRGTLLTFRARHDAGSAVAFDGMFSYRRGSIRTFNGDDSDYDECEDGDFGEFLCSDEGEGEPVADQFARLIPVDEDDELNGTNNTSKTVTDGWSGAFQTTVVKPLSDRPNHFVAGATFDGGRSNYEADTEIARLTNERGTSGTGLFDEEAAVRLRTTVRHAGIYAADFFTAAPRLTLMAAARFNYSVHALRDQRGTELDGDHSFSRLNPAVGLTYELSREATAYSSFSVSSRVPAPSELSCADPEDPCRLPNAFVADPPLDQVVARTWEGGIRGHRQGLSWNASMFRTANTDDIMFISSGPLTNTGHFENIGDTLRQGLELGASGMVNAVRWGVAYSFLRARFDSPLTLSSPNHPDEEDGEVEVEAGSRIPGVPQHNLKANLSATIKRLTIGGSVLTTSKQYLRGDEANLLPTIDGFSVANLTASYAIARHIALTARVTNLFDSEHSTFGLLGEADEVLGDDYEDPRFLSPGAPRAAWVGLEFSFR
ncbi:MAG: TonB-dependent receptor [Luteitalea sp.]|nr:TonB-dependent receptor [Luteitalea sp.]